MGTGRILHDHICQIKSELTQITSYYNLTTPHRSVDGRVLGGDGLFFQAASGYYGQVYHV